MLVSCTGTRLMVEVFVRRCKRSRRRRRLKSTRPAEGWDGTFLEGGNLGTSKLRWQWRLQ